MIEALCMALAFGVGSIVFTLWALFMLFLFKSFRALWRAQMR